MLRKNWCWFGEFDLWRGGIEGIGQRQIDEKEMWNTKSCSFSWWLMGRCFETGTECWKVDAHQLANTRGIRDSTVEVSHGCHLRN